jgi:hypothetical protein
MIRYKKIEIFRGLKNNKCDEWVIICSSYQLHLLFFGKPFQSKKWQMITHIFNK